MNREPPLTDRDAVFEERARALLSASSDAVEGRIRSRLTAARFVALGELEKRSVVPRFRVPGTWLPAGALAAAALLVIAVWAVRPDGATTAVVAEVSPVEDAEILASNEEPELYSDDADFYEWAGSDSNGGPG